MLNYKKSLLMAAIIFLIIPLSVSAFWPWSKNKDKIDDKKTEQATQVSGATSNNQAGLSDAAKLIAAAKYKTWEDGFEKENVDAIINNQNNFWFTTAELSYLFNTVGAEIKKPFLSNLNLYLEDSLLKVSADFQKFIKGQLTFDLRTENRNEHLLLNLSKVRLFGFPVPATLLERPINSELEDYFEFLYEDERYQGFDLSINENILKLDLRFN